MKTLKLLFNFVACLCLVFSSTAAQAENIKISLADLNYISSQVALESSVRYYFRTKEDAHQITYDWLKLAKISEKWSWRYETENEKILFRLNGRVQFAVKPIDAREGQFEVNGQPFTFKKGISYKVQMETFEKIVLSSQANLDQLFFDEAFAVPPLVIFTFAAFTMFGMASSTAQAEQRTERYGQCRVLAINSGPAFNIVNSSSFCRNQGAVGMRLVANNFDKGCVNGWTRDCDGRSYSCKKWKDVGQCIRHKIKSPPTGWGLRQSEAAIVCQTAYESIHCARPSPVIIERRDGPTNWGPVLTCLKSDCGNAYQKGIVDTQCRQGNADCCRIKRENPKCGDGPEAPTNWGPADICDKRDCRHKNKMLRLFREKGIQDCMLRYNSCNNSREKVGRENTGTGANR